MHFHLFVTLLLLTGFGNSAIVHAQTYQERQLIQLFNSKTRKPLPAEREAKQKEWNRLRLQHQAYLRQKKQSQVSENNNYGRKLANAQGQVNSMLPLQQAGLLGETLRRSSVRTRNALDRQRKIQFLLKQSRKNRNRNKLKPTPPYYRIEFIPR